MFERSDWYKGLADILDRESSDQMQLSTAEKRLLFCVELGLFLLETLGFGDQPIEALWVVLSGLPFPSISSLPPEKHRSISIARILLPYSSRSSWEQALSQYARLPASLRIYNVSTDLPFDEQILDACLNALTKGRSRRDVYQRTLSNVPPPARSNRPFAHAGEAKITVYTDKGPFPLTINLPSSVTEDVPVTPLRSNKAHREPLSVTYDMLLMTAQMMDQRLTERDRDPIWVSRVERNIHYHAVRDQNVSKEANTTPIHLDGSAHIAGMVGSGKSTLMKLIAAYVAMTQPGRVLVIVVGDTMSALDIVDELNSILMEDSERPVAIPLIGKSTRHKHLKDIWSREHPERRGALRWLNTACPLMGLMSTAQITTLEGTPVPGREPCERVQQKSEQDGRADPKLHAHLCPLFHRCPSQQVWNDLPEASIYVTTPGAIVKSRIPGQVDRRKPRYGESIYTEADFVVFDEADTVMQWFDNEYATVLDLWGREGAVFTRADPLSSQSLTDGVNALEERWVRAERHATVGIVDILRQLSQSHDATILRNWIGDRYFTASYLFHNLTLSLLGLSANTVIDEQSMEIRSAYKALLQDFEVVADRDPLSFKRPRRESYQDEDAFIQASSRYRLAEFMRWASVDGGGAVVSESKEWIQDRVPDIEEYLRQLNATVKESKLPAQTVDQLALKLAFALCVALLDRNLRIVFYEWYNQPEQVSEALGQQTYHSSSNMLSDVLPIPATGRIFGTYYLSKSPDVEASGVLSRFEYSNVGRYLLLHFHELLLSLDIPGPHILALSGTSWLPYSTQWDVGIPIQGVLQAPEAERECIRRGSQFYFSPQYYPDGRPIRISGEDDKLAAMSALAKVMAKPLLQELEIIADLAHQSPELWEGREKLLLLTNSYDQAQAFAKTLSDYWPDKSEIFYITKSQGNKQDDGFELLGTIVRADVEMFAGTRGRILVAPMSAIGRGYNILTLDRKRAAFGAVYFLTRPMPHPYDVQALAGELNAYTLRTCTNDAEPLWENPGVYAQGRAFRSATRAYWARAEMRQGYRTLSPEERKDLAATTFGLFVQAAGRLVRGGVPFHAFFVDGAWAPNSARPPEDVTPQSELDGVKDSLLTQMVTLIEEYIDDSEIGNSLYQPFEGMLDTNGFYPNRKGDY